MNKHRSNAKDLEEIFKEKKIVLRTKTKKAKSSERKKTKCYTLCFVIHPSLRQPRDTM